MRILLFYLTLAFTLGCSSPTLYENDAADNAMFSAEEQFVQAQAALADAKDHLHEVEERRDEALVNKETAMQNEQSALMLRNTASDENDAIDGEFGENSRLRTGLNEQQLNDVQLLLKKANETMTESEKVK